MASPEEVSRRILEFVKHRYNDGKGNEFVYFCQSCKNGTVKVGVTRSMHKRLLQLRKDVDDLKIVALVRGNRHIEWLFHRAFANDRNHGEWYNCSHRIRKIISIVSGNMDRRYKNIMSALNYRYCNTSQVRNIKGGKYFISVKKIIKSIHEFGKNGAGDGVRTRDLGIPFQRVKDYKTSA